MSFLKRLLCGVLVLSGLTVSVSAANKPENLCMYIRAQAPRISAPKAMHFAKEIVDDPHFDAELAIFASAFGHPNYEGLSKKENIGLFFFRKIGEPMEYVLVAKFKKNGTLKNDLLSHGLHVKDIDNWSLVSTSTNVLDRLATKELVQITEKDLRSDIEICPMLKQLSENLNIDTVDQIFQLKDEDSAKRVRLALGTIRDEIDDLRKVTVSIYFGEDDTKIETRIDAQPGSGIGNLFSADAGGTMNIPQYPFGPNFRPFTSTFSCINMDTCRTFTNRLWHKLLKNSDLTKTDIKIQQIVDDFDEFGKRFNGQSACFSFVSNGPDSDALLVIFNGLFDDPYAKRVCQEVLPHIDFDGKCASNTPLRYNKHNIYAVEYPDFTVYTCACRNNLVICDSLNILEKVIDNIFDSKTKVSLAKGCALTSIIDFHELFEVWKTSGVLGSSALPSDFSNVTIKPFKHQINLAKNRYTSSLKVDNKSLKHIFKILPYIDMSDVDDAKNGEVNIKTKKTNDVNLTPNETIKHE